MDSILLELDNYKLTVQQVSWVGLIILAWIGTIYMCRRNFFTSLGLQDTTVHKETKRLIMLMVHVIFTVIVLYLLDLNFTLVSTEGNNGFTITVLDVVLSFLIVKSMTSLDKIGVAMLPSNKEESAFVTSKKPTATASRLVHYILFAVALVLLINNFNLDKQFHLALGGDNELSIGLSNIIIAILIILIARLLYWIITSILLQSFYHAKKVDRGVRFALNQLLAYVIFFIGVIIALQNLGINMGLMWAGAAALLVGVGIGLQQTFADFFAGITMLFERSVKIGDVLELPDIRGIVKRIGLRTSVIITPEEKRLVIPNSILTNARVNNWSQNSRGIRFAVSIGVAYGSDTTLVKSILLNIMEKTKGVLSNPKPFVRFDDFGDSALMFTIHFYSRQYMKIEDVKSNIRFEIDDALRQNNIAIPFPQRDIWIRKEE
ncbi:MAG: mechanosensitive ion channel domain-containing protein [Saprospiraceae bacterium]